MKLPPPCTYQGSKQRLAGEIVDYINAREGVLSGGGPFYDICCGCGAVSLELAGRGFDADRLRMCDAGPWGLFWSAVGDGSFDMNRFRDLLSDVPADRASVKSYVTGLAGRDPGADAVYIFLILQSCSFGGRQVWLEHGRWRHSSFRDYWQPTETSVRRSPVNPMQPNRDELARRVGAIIEACRGLTCFHGDVRDMDPAGVRDSVVYMDPPYPGTTGYFRDFDISSQVRRFLDAGARAVYVSLDRPLSDEAVRLNFRGPKGGISGNKAGKGQEWLSAFRP